MAHEYLAAAAQEVWSTFDLEDLIIDYNRTADESAFTFPIASKDIGKVERPKTGFGVVLNVQVKTKRDAIGRKIWQKLEPKTDEIRNIFLKAFEDNDQQVDIEDIQYVRDQGWSAGAKTILMNMYTYTKAKEPKRSRYPQKFVIAFKGLKNDAADPHEVMTGSLIQMSQVYNIRELNQKDPKERETAIDDITKLISQNAKKVKGSKDSEIKAINGDFVNLAKALSVSNYVVDLLVNKYGYNINNVYQTGAQWQGAVRPFEGFDPKALKSQDFIIKSYNSADLIVEFGKGKNQHYWGLSLKKKGIAKNEPDPTLLNKPVTGKGSFKSSTGKGTRDGYLTYKLANSKARYKLVEGEKRFWRDVYIAKYGMIPKGSSSSWMKQLDSVLSGDEKNAALTGKEFLDRRSGRNIKYPENSYFKEIDIAFREVFKEPANFREFLDIVFRINIDPYVNKKQFHFSLITGAGDLKPDGTLEVKKANEKSSVLMNEVFASLFGRKGLTDRDYIIETTKGKYQAFDMRASAAKLFYTMKIGRVGRPLPIVNLEVRYKGAITNNPQFQVFIHTNFQRFMAAAKRQLGSKHAFDPSVGK
tara:strand:- start:70 stop:1827 length:1758 start_codon:yes stop_codon:yes gene_type:complete